MTDIPMTTRQTLLDWKELGHLHTALDVLLGCYADGLDSEIVRTIVEEHYGPGTSQREEARQLFDKLKVIASIPVETLSQGTDWDSPRKFWNDGSH